MKLAAAFLVSALAVSAAAQAGPDYKEYWYGDVNGDRRDQVAETMPGSVITRLGSLPECLQYIEDVAKVRMTAHPQGWFKAVCFGSRTATPPLAAGTDRMDVLEQRLCNRGACQKP